MDGRRSPTRDAPKADRPAEGDEPPSVLGSWKGLYALVIGELLLVIAFCAWLSARGR